MKKSDLKNGMIVETTNGSMGVVVIKDATDENCIKFAYDSDRLLNHGFDERIDKLDWYDEDLNAYCIVREGDVWNQEGHAVGEKLYFYQIIRAYEPKLVWERSNL